MAIIQQPDAMSMSGNIKKFIVSSGETVSFVLKDGATVLLDASYEPGADGRVTIDVQDIVESRLSFLITHENFYQQKNVVKTFTAVIDGTEYTFRAIRSGVANLSDTPGNWLKGNFLTWQPVNKQVTYYSPEWLTYYAVEACTIKLKATFPDNTEQTVTIGSCEAGKAFTCNVQYAVICGLLGQLYPQHYEVYVENGSGTRLSYIQRYLYSEVKSEQEQWFLFENSLGGLDTIRAYGDSDFTGEHQHKISKSGDVSSEYDIDTNRLYNKNTGYLNEYERRWLLDFFPSKAKYIYTAAALRAIVVSESDVKYSVSDLPSSYSFKYAFSDALPFLNLIRNEESIPDNIVIPNIDSPDFILPPRLAEYPRVPLSEGVILPAFEPHSETPGVTTFGAILNAAVVEVLNKIQAGEGGGELVEILRSTDPRDPSDYSVFSSLRTLLEVYAAIEEKGSEYFLSKTNTDAAAGLIRFLAGAEFGEFVSGMFTGKGARIDNLGNAEFQSLTVRSSMKILELIINRLSAIEGDQVLTESDTIESIVDLGDGTYGLYLREKWEGYFTGQVENNVIRGMINTLASGGKDYYTSWMRVNSVNAPLNYIEVTLYPDNETPDGINHPPVELMKIARWGNQTNEERQSCIYISSTEGRITHLTGVTKPIIDAGNYGSTFGSLPEFLKELGLPVSDGRDGVYVKQLFARDIIRIDHLGRPSPTFVDRGEFDVNEDYYSGAVNPDTGVYETSDVWYLGCKWRCMANLTKSIPRWNNTDWAMIEGNPEFTVEFMETENIFDPDNFNATLTILAKLHNQDVTDDIRDTDIVWTRYSEDLNGVERVSSDNAWAQRHAAAGKSINLTADDADFLGYVPLVLRFTATVTLRDGITGQANIEYR